MIPECFSFIRRAGPFRVGKHTNVKWMILSQGAGFDGGTATIRVSGPDGPVLSRGAMRGFKFHNGQIVGDLETRPTDKDHVKDYYAFEVIPVASASSGSQLYKAEFPNLSIPPMTAGRTTQILILFVLYDLESQTAGEWEINVSTPAGSAKRISPRPAASAHRGGRTGLGAGRVGAESKNHL